MKPSFSPLLRLLSLAAAVSLCTLSQARADTLRWDASGTSPADPTDGAGTWSTADANWSDGTTDSVWNNGNNDTAVFGAVDSGATVALGSAITASGITFSSGGSAAYTISNGSNASNILTLVGDATITTNRSSTISAVITGTSGLNAVVTSGGTITLSAANTYTGVTTIGGLKGILRTSNLHDGGIASGIGMSGSDAANLVLDGGILRLASSSSAQSTNRLFTLTEQGGRVDNENTNQTRTLEFTNTGAIVLSGTDTARTFTLGGGNTGDNTFALTLGDNGTGVTSFAKVGAGKWILTGKQTYTGDTTVSQGTLSLANTSELMFKIQNAGVSNKVFDDNTSDSAGDKTGMGTVDFDGILRLDISGLTDATGTWNLVDVATLNATFGADFGVAFLDGPSFTDGGNGIYTSGNWSFDTTTGNLSAIPEPSTFAMLLASAGMLLGLGRFRRSGV